MKYYKKYTIIRNSVTYLVLDIIKTSQDYERLSHPYYSIYDTAYISLCKVNDFKRFNIIDFESHPKDIRIIQIIHLI